MTKNVIQERGLFALAQNANRLGCWCAVTVLVEVLQWSNVQIHYYL